VNLVSVIEEWTILKGGYLVCGWIGLSPGNRTGIWYRPNEVRISSQETIEKEREVFYVVSHGQRFFVGISYTTPRYLNVPIGHYNDISIS